MATSLPPLPSLGSDSDPFYSTDATNPASALYVPPVGSYQDDAGQVVPNTASNTATSTPSIFQQAVNAVNTGITGGVPSQSNSGDKIFGISLEDIIFMVLGLLLIAAGVFAFRGTQTIVETGGKIAAKAAEVTA